jgi:hypothetical protein
VLLQLKRELKGLKFCDERKSQHDESAAGREEAEQISLIYNLSSSLQEKHINAQFHSTSTLPIFPPSTLPEQGPQSIQDTRSHGTDFSYHCTPVTVLFRSNISRIRHLLHLLLG